MQSNAVCYASLFFPKLPPKIRKRRNELLGRVNVPVQEIDEESITEIKVVGLSLDEVRVFIQSLVEYLDAEKRSTVIYRGSNGLFTFLVQDGRVYN